MSARNRDDHNRWRSITVGFRVAFNASQVGEQTASLGGILILKTQSHGSDGRLDLVSP